MSVVLRCFIAIELPEALKAALHEAAAPLRAAAPGIKWVRPDSLHLTLKFLGSTPEERVGAIGSALSEVAARHRHFEVRLSGAGAFPSLRAPRVVWLGVSIGGGGELAPMVSDIEAAMEPLGYPRETRPYSAHLTLGRARDLRPVEARKLAEAMEAMKDKVLGGFESREISLMSSELSPGGARYKALHKAPLEPQP